MDPNKYFNDHIPMIIFQIIQEENKSFGMNI